MTLPIELRLVLLAYARTVMASRPPDSVIAPTGETYMERWHAVRRNDEANVYVHRFLRSDYPVMHDHPWDNASVVLDGAYEEETPSRSFWREEGEVVVRRAEAAHRVVIHDGPVLTMFLSGPVRRVWGFHCPKGWVPFHEYVKSAPDTASIGRGCGDG